MVYVKEHKKEKENEYEEIWKKEIGSGDDRYGDGGEYDGKYVSDGSDNYDCAAKC